MASGISTRGLVFSALFAALFVCLSFIEINLGIGPVPITMQNFAVMLMGGLLGARYGFFSIFLIVLLGALGVPVFQGEGGMAKLLGGTGGYIWMYPVAAFLIGLIVTRIKGSGVVQWILVFLTMEVFGSLLLYVTGVPWLQHVTHWTWDKALALGFYPYLIGDLLKAVLASFIVLQVRKSYPPERLTR
jgi:biotin transport system substrate-specific component